MKFCVKTDLTDPRAVDPLVYGKFEFLRDVDRTKCFFFFESKPGAVAFMANYCHLNPEFIGEYGGVVTVPSLVIGDFFFPWDRK